MMADATREDERRRLVRAIEGIYDAVKTGGVFSGDAPLAEDARIVCYLPSVPEFPLAGEWRGRDGFEGWMRAQAACMAYRRFDVRAIECGEDTMTAVIDVAFRHHPSGADYEGAITHVIHHRGGVIEQWHAHINPARLEAAVRHAQIVGGGHA